MSLAGAPSPKTIPAKRILKPVDAPAVIMEVRPGSRQCIPRRGSSQEAIQLATIRCLDEKNPGRLLVRLVAKRLLRRLATRIRPTLKQVDRHDAWFLQGWF